MERRIITTADGSHSIFVPEMNEHYHSGHGALQESQHVFIDAGLKSLPLNDLAEIHILEMGFGTGLNAYLTLLETALLPNCEVFYTSIEAYPIDIITVETLNYPMLLNASTDIFAALHSAMWGDMVGIAPHFRLLKYNDLLQDIALPNSSYHLIYYDAFAPNKQPELWTQAIFEKLYAALRSNGFLTTYCAKGEVKRTLRAVGFRVEARPGPRGKREMTVAFK